MESKYLLKNSSTEEKDKIIKENYNYLMEEIYNKMSEDANLI
jgi:hypothetical protein